MKPKQDSQPPLELWRRQLSSGLREMHVMLSGAQQQQLLAYLALLSKWNRAYNLTAVRDPGRMVSRQLLDSLSILRWIRGPRVLDAGTGAGLPGIPLAIALPEYEFVLLDSNGKKTRFIQQAILQLGLSNVSVRQERVESFKDPSGFDTITSRAFTDLHRMLDLTAHLRVPAGWWAAMKGGLEEFDPESLPAGFSARIEALRVPDESAVRHLVLIHPKATAIP